MTENYIRCMYKYENSEISRPNGSEEHVSRFNYISFQIKKLMRTYNHISFCWSHWKCVFLSGQHLYIIQLEKRTRTPPNYLSHFVAINKKMLFCVFFWFVVFPFLSKKNARVRFKRRAIWAWVGRECEYRISLTKIKTKERERNTHIHYTRTTTTQASKQPGHSQWHKTNYYYTPKTKVFFNEKNLLELE